jgi:hypothetical protein
MIRFGLRRASLGLASLAALSLFLLGGCISTRAMKEKVPEAASISILTPSRQGGMVVLTMGDAKSWLPLYGFVKTMAAAGAQERVNQRLDDHGFDIGQELQQTLLASLRSQAVPAERVDIERPTEFIPSPLAKSALPDARGAWALLDAQITGYGLSTEMSGEFRPWVAVRVRLVEAKSKAVLYDQRFTYNYWAIKAERIPFEPADQWRDLDAVEQDLGGVRLALVRGLSKISARVAADLAGK